MDELAASLELDMQKEQLENIEKEDRLVGQGSHRSIHFSKGFVNEMKNN